MVELLSIFTHYSLPLLVQQQVCLLRCHHLLGYGLIQLIIEDVPLARPFHKGNVVTTGKCALVHDDPKEVVAHVTMRLDAGGRAVGCEVQGEWELHLSRDLFHRGELETLDVKHHYLGSSSYLHLDPRACLLLAPAAPVPLPLAIDLLLPSEPSDASV